MGSVLFTSVRPLERAENLKAVYDAYDGDKEYMRTIPRKVIPDLHSGKYKLLVTDELPSDTPGKCIFIGHGMGAGKLYGLDQPGRYFNRPDLITYAIASSVDMIPTVMRFSGVTANHVIPLGMPRTDAYFKIAKVKREHKKYLYVPTFRRGNWQPNWEKLAENLTEDERFIVKPHMVTKTILQGSYKNIKEISSEEPSTEYLIQTDVLITDYSSIMFDAMVLRKPIVLFAKDKYDYLANRGMYYPYPEKYSRHFYDTEKSLIVLGRKAEWDDYCEELKQFYTGACDGHSTERTIDLIRSVL